MNGPARALLRAFLGMAVATAGGAAFTAHADSAAPGDAVPGSTVPGSTVPGSVAPTGPAPNGAAAYGDRTIDLSRSWEGAQACAVLSAAVTCYGTYREANAVGVRNGGSAGDATVLGTADCPAGWVCVYEHPAWDGRRLQFRDERWVGLARYGFARQVSSWHNNQNCSGGRKRDGASLRNGSGRSMTMAACARSGSIGSFNDAATDIHG
ncbi:hypothetical protein GCM10010156_04530 [Planobispora rosea]|uniref:Peptidase inhibitor family I36 n=1 Tax=Planobispora rosea TaxID=35762 RepID=A0A8J3RXQ7_PLARO|nr:peptidase inhibitor family I36 protein [Planobispora rosea]GGS48966.1 hypothetical protein GCM10010156_04530 [Planobispora rosea]GIH83737.1 hypothetical protein Pro02_21450 [Planobispora rosea]